MQKFYHNIGFWEKRHFFAKNCQKSQKIVIITSTPGSLNSARKKSKVSLESSGAQDPRKIGGYKKRNSASKFPAESKRKRFSSGDDFKMWSYPVPCQCWILSSVSTVNIYIFYLFNITLFRIKITNLRLVVCNIGVGSAIYLDLNEPKRRLSWPVF
jgi:hypothetical protein